MRILHIYKDYPPILGGIENHLQWLAQGQAARGHQVTVLVTNPKGLQTLVTEEGGVRVIRAARLATVASTPLSPGLSGRLLSEDPDVVHLHFPYPVGEVSQWLANRGRATVLTYHSDIVRQAGILRFYRPLMLRVLEKVNAIVVGSPPMRDSRYLAPFRQKVRLIPYGIPLVRFLNQNSADQARVRAQYLDGDGPRLLFVGRLRYYKGLDCLIRAMSTIPARLLVAGIGPMEADWQELARATGVADRIQWLGEVPDRDLPALYQLSDLFVLPATHPSEAFGLVQVEAMASGLPVVCTELGTGTSYVNQDGITGIVVPPNDPTALATAITSLLLDAEMRGRMGQAARQRVQDEFDLPAMVDRVLALYLELCNPVK